MARPLADGGLLGLPLGLTSPQPAAKQAAGQGDGAADQGQQHRQPNEGGKHQPIPSP
jgi:hypothetical protein